MTASRMSTKTGTSPRAGGVGLNLTAASYVFHFDRWWNPAVESQAEDRAHRIGQIRPVHVYSYLSVATVEERVSAILAEKRQLFADVVDGVSLRHIRRLDLPTLLRAAGAPDHPKGLNVGPGDRSLARRNNAGFGRQ